MAKDNVALLKRFIDDEDRAQEAGTVGQIWEAERGRIGALVGHAWRHLSWKECEALYAHLMRRTRRLPQVQASEFMNLGKAYVTIDPDWDRIGLAFRFGRTPRAILATGFVDTPQEFEARRKILDRFSGFPDRQALFRRAGRFRKDGEAYASVALDALRTCGYTETRDEDAVPDSLTYWGLMLLVAFDAPKWNDCCDELACLPAFQENKTHVAGMAGAAEAVEAAAC